MTQTELNNLIGLALRRNSVTQGTPVFNVEANIEKLSSDIAKVAINKVGRTQAVAFNKQRVTFDLEDGTALYKIGTDILKNNPMIRNLQYLYMTDSQVDPPIEVVDFDAFSAWKRGSDTTGKPRKATLHSREMQLEVWPTPDSNYEVIAYAKENVTSLEDIPDEYHDAVVATAYEIIHAAASPSMATKLAEESEHDMQGDSQTGTAPSIIRARPHLGVVDSRSRADSYNTTGE